EDLESYHRQWWQPANAAVVVTGGLDSASASALAQRLFQSWGSAGTSPQPPADTPASYRPRTIVVDLPEAPQAMVLAALPAAGRNSPDFQNVAMATSLLGAGSTSRMFEEIRAKRGLSYGPSAEVSPLRSQSAITASAPTKHETVPEVAEIILAELERMQKQPPAAAAIDPRRRGSIGFRGREAETSSGFANAIADLVLRGVPAAQASSFVAELDAVTAEGVAQASAKWLSPDRASLIVVGDASKFIEKLRQLRPDVEVIKWNELDLDGLRNRAGVHAGPAPPKS
ncbi:MAG TPA: insulinase family protein, partial [Allosphingosinicella sp.]|nr:insulinase family protein [Allosphingosinicella sp.]